jgi:hypothetical protein
MRLVLLASALLLIAGCTTVFPSSRLGGPQCHPTSDTLSRVTYDEHSQHVAIGCAGCSEVYVAAQYQWLARRYPGYVVHEHSTASDFGGKGPLLSCFDFETPDKLEHRVCFADSGWCQEAGHKS